MYLSRIEPHHLIFVVEKCHKCLKLIISEKLKTSKLTQETGLLGQLLLEHLLTSAHDVLRLDAHDTATPLTVGILVVVEGAFHESLELVQVLLVLLLALGDGQASGGLLVDELSQARLGLDDAVRDLHLAAEGRQPADGLDRVDVVGDHDELSLLVLNQGGDVVQAELEASRGLGVDGLTVLLGLGGLGETLLLLGVSLRLELLQEAGQGLELFLVDGVLELSDGRRDLQALEQDALLALDADVLRPLGEAGQVALRLDVTTDAELTRGLLIGEVLLDRGLGVSTEGRGRDLLLRGSLLCHFKSFLRSPFTTRVN